MKFTGEFFIPTDTQDNNQGNAELEIEHKQRYLSILAMVADKTVLDIASGEGYGTFLLSSKAKKVVGVDINPELVQHAGQKYKQENLTFLQGSVEEIPLESGSVDIIVSFETLEHVYENTQKKFIAETKRVLKPGGVFIVSTPNRKNYTDRFNHHNEFHLHELYSDEFETYLKAHFAYVQIYDQGLEVSSLILNKEHYLSHQPLMAIPIKENYHFEGKYLIGICSDVAERLQHPITSIVAENEKSYFNLIDRILELQREVEELGSWGTRLSGEVEEVKTWGTNLAGEVEELKGWGVSLARELEEERTRGTNLTGEVEELKGWGTNLAGEVETLKKEKAENITYYSNLTRKLQEELARSNHNAFLLEAELEVVRRVNGNKRSPSPGIVELTGEINRLNQLISHNQPPNAPKAGPVNNGPGFPPVQQTDHLKEQINKLQDDVRWYKNTYQERSFLGVIRQKIADKFHK